MNKLQRTKQAIALSGLAIVIFACAVGIVFWFLGLFWGRVSLGSATDIVRYCWKLIWWTALGAGCLYLFRIICTKHTGEKTDPQKTTQRQNLTQSRNPYVRAKCANEAVWNGQSKWLDEQKHYIRLADVNRQVILAVDGPSELMPSAYFTVNTRTMQPYCEIFRLDGDVVYARKAEATWEEVRKFADAGQLNALGSSGDPDHITVVSATETADSTRIRWRVCPGVFQEVQLLCQKDGHYLNKRVDCGPDDASPKSESLHLGEASCGSKEVFRKAAEPMVDKEYVIELLWKHLQSARGSAEIIQGLPEGTIRVLQVLFLECKADNGAAFSFEKTVKKAELVQCGKQRYLRLIDSDCFAEANGRPCARLKEEYYTISEADSEEITAKNWKAKVSGIPDYYNIQYSNDILFYNNVPIDVITVKLSPVVQRHYWLCNITLEYNRGTWSIRIEDVSNRWNDEDVMCRRTLPASFPKMTAEALAAFVNSIDPCGPGQDGYRNVSAKEVEPLIQAAENSSF